MSKIYNEMWGRDAHLHAALCFCVQNAATPSANFKRDAL